MLIHVLDSSGTADAEGNAVVVDLTAEDADGSNPLDDLDWIFNELIQWVFCNLITKWNGIVRRGQEKVSICRKVLFYFCISLPPLTFHTFSFSLLVCSLDINRIKPLFMMCLCLWRNIYMKRKVATMRLINLILGTKVIYIGLLQCSSEVIVQQ